MSSDESQVYENLDDGQYEEPINNGFDKIRSEWVAREQRDLELAEDEEEHEYTDLKPLLTSKAKHEAVVSESLGDKLVADLAGIDHKLATRLRRAGYTDASTVLGKYLVLHKDEARFKQWLAVTCSADKRQQGECFRCIHEWCDQFL